MHSKPSMVLILLCLASQFLLAQHTPSIFAKKTPKPIKIDGVLDDPIWQSAASSSDFQTYFPSDTALATKQTQIYLSYDDEYLYIAARCESVNNDYVVPSLKRDYSARGSDNLTFVFDTYCDKTNAFVFGTNPMGVLREALISNGGNRLPNDWNMSWDNKWHGESKIYDTYWTTEMAIPFKTLRYTEEGRKWRFNCYRFDSQTNERSVWYPIPQAQIITSLAFMGNLEWEEPLKGARNNISVIPYVTANANRDFEDAQGKTQSNFEFGGDAKIAITSGLNLDLTVNPDFSQVEVDRQVTDLSRFEIFFPERRQFFLENADLFSGFGSRRTTPFFSRRIGIGQDTTTDQAIQIPILYGARLSGKIGNDWRVGLLNMQTAEDEQNGMPGFNYTVATAQKKVFNRSNLGFILVNKQRMSDEEGGDFDPYNRVIGVDYNLASANNRWVGKTFIHRAITPEDTTDSKIAHGLRLKYISRPFSVEWLHAFIGDGFNSEVGFVRQRNVYRVNPEFKLFFYPAQSIINRHTLGFDAESFWRTDGQRIDHDIEMYWQGEFTNTSRLRVTFQNEYSYLIDEFDPTGIDATPLPAETGYGFNSLELRYNSDRRRKVAYQINTYTGQFYNGMRYNLSGNINYRFQPFGSIALNADYNYIKLPSPYATTSLWLLGPRLDLTFTKKVFLTTFIQYNSQIDNININVRFQWRYKPVSDFFIVYTDNYTNDFAAKSRAIVAKFTYWLNL